MRYATWTLQTDPTTGELVGPIAAAQEQGIKLEPVVFVGDASDNVILGRYDGDVLALDAWGFLEISKETAIEIFSSVFTPMPEDVLNEVKGVTLEDALAALLE